MFNYRSPKSLKFLMAAVALSLLVSAVFQGLAVARAEAYGYVQSTCPALVKQAIDNVSAECSKAGRGKLCYGNSTISAEYQPGVSNVKFNAPGDTVDVGSLKRFTLSGLDLAAKHWGVAQMKIKADLPDADPTQAVTMILFGNVQVTDANADASVAAATATQVAGLANSTTAAAPAPSANKTKTATATPGFPIDMSPNLYPGMQAFYFQSGNTALCDQAPHDGLLIQAPQGNNARVTLVINSVTVSLGSTVYITAQPGQFFTVNTLEGSASVTAFGQTIPVFAGMSAQIPIDARMRASAAPLARGYFVPDSVRAVPTGVFPDKTVLYAGGLPPNLVFNDYKAVRALAYGPCTFDGQNATFVSKVGYNDGQLWYNGSSALVKSEPGTYSQNETYADPARTFHGGPLIVYTNFTLTVLNADHITGLSTYADNSGLNCAYNWDLIRIVAIPPTVPRVATRIPTRIPTRVPTQTPTATMTPTATFNPNLQTFG